MHRADRQFLLTSIFVLCTLIITFATMFAHADHFYVSTSGNNSNSGTSAGDAWRTITYAIETAMPTITLTNPGTASDPHIVHVAPGTYTYNHGDSNNEEFPITWSDEHVWLVGDDRDTTIVEYGNFEDYGAYIEGMFEVVGYYGYIYGATISTLTIRDGVSEMDGGAIYVSQADVTVDNCLIEDCHSLECGGAISVGSDYYGAGDLLVKNCTIQNNWANYGGGISAKFESTLDVVNTLIYHNEARYLNSVGGDGGGIYMQNTPANTCLIEDCDIIENEADWYHGHGGGIYLYNSHPHISHNMIREDTVNNYGGDGNTAYEGGGIYLTEESAPLIDGWNEIAHNVASLSGGGLYARDIASTPEITGNEFFGNVAYDGNGGAICSNQSSMEVKNNWIGWNEANQSGGGVYCIEGSGSVHSLYDINWIHSNTADNTGGGICFLNGDGNTLLSNNNIFYNLANSGGDGIHLENSNGLVLKNNGIWDNGNPQQNFGEGIRVDGGTATLFNNLVFARAYNGEDTQSIGVFVRGTGDLTIRNLTIADHTDTGLKADARSNASIWVYDTIIWGNATSIDPGGSVVEVFYSDIEGGWTGTGSNNIDEDPKFIGLSGALGWPDGYFLKQEAAGQSETSPCVDAGSSSAATSYYAPYMSDYSTRTDAVSDTDCLDMGYHYLHEGATYIELESFEAKGLNEKVRITWTTGTELDNAGFDIYRKLEGETDLVKVNSALIPAKGSSGAGASYSFVDVNVKSGKTYLYYLVDIDTNGKTTTHGPVNATPFALSTPSLRNGSDGVLPTLKVAAR
ncbi:MAG: right-handed parallel beta-helix repeat-containing protein [Candidatus Coatesbacteria bacterium]|nr:right-handed parallel beta-helix repeat-containing protein [Candidatus Coatesbacteria bacterium]